LFSRRPFYLSRVSLNMNVLKFCFTSSFFRRFLADLLSGRLLLCSNSTVKSLLLPLSNFSFFLTVSAHDGTMYANDPFGGGLEHAIALFKVTSYKVCLSTRGESSKPIGPRVLQVITNKLSFHMYQHA